MLNIICSCKLKQQWGTTVNIKMAKFHPRQIALLNADQDAERSNSHSLLVGLKNGTAPLEYTLVVSYKVKHNLTI